MELYRLKYFLSVAQQQNFHHAAKTTGISVASLSKAVSGLEDELGVRLFERQGRNIRLTPSGLELRAKAKEIIELEESVRFSVSGGKSRIEAIITGPEVLLAKFGVDFIQPLLKNFNDIQIRYVGKEDKEAMEKVLLGDADLALLTIEPDSRLTSKPLGKVHFVTCASENHTFGKTKGKISITEVLKYSFVVPDQFIYGSVQKQQSPDGWRDDMFPRKKSFLTSSLSTVVSLVHSGKALAYLPDYIAVAEGFKVVDVEGCPYTCTQEIRLVAKAPERLSWLNSLF
ncbi:MAG: hypothetical protein CL678_09420 [Bdellovibrionaceae bacterium]|nr:hypothetical protein [Pseudobdellovibrionaceae bacterium]|tara:strand:- start:3239 stop:4093 length:855 start_codon:yes stop_codon:yes gene_type:complete